MKRSYPCVGCPSDVPGRYVLVDEEYCLSFSEGRGCKDFDLVSRKCKWLPFRGDEEIESW